MGIPDHLTCLLRNLYAGQEATVRTGHGTISSVQSLSHVWLFATPWTAAHQASLSFTISPEFAQTQVHWVSDAIQPSHPLSPPSPSAFTVSHHQVFPNESVPCIRWPKYWNFSFSISSSNECSALISFRMGWLDILAVQGTLKSLLQQQVQKHQFFSTQLSSQSNSHIHTWPQEKP